MDNKETTLKYFHSWQGPTDFDELSAYLVDGFKIDTGFFSFENKTEFIQFPRSNPAPWRDVNLLSSIFSGNESAILYEGINKATNKKMRVSEHIKCRDGNMSEIHKVIAQLDRIVCNQRQNPRKTG